VEDSDTEKDDQLAKDSEMEYEEALAVQAPTANKDM
jgi:hypothetical protein